MIEDYRDPEVLRRMYWDENLTHIQMAMRLMVSPATVQHWMVRHGIPCRGDFPRPRTVRIGDESLTCREIAERTGISPSAAWQRIRAGWYGEDLLLPPGKRRGQ